MGIFTTEAVQYGMESEDKAVGLYIKEMQQEGITVEVKEVELLLSKTKPFLGASLDRVITNLDSNEKWGMEIKSPFSKAGMTVEDACKTKHFFLEKLNDRTIRLKKNTGLLHSSPRKNVCCLQFRSERYCIYRVFWRGIAFI